ncbi:MYND finger family protein [Zea mays]|uniref:Histone-lysine N-methyltransferase ATXR2 n=1 Tax=Zea mays TaxID=4577 RepID=C0HEI2_MAIZE|nr:MYND finger family protein [Zea mays]ACN25435.1 unknown [Zea mays]ONM13357.1 Histone-lysine N-methyltransferase ATXR2 [Zea mays]|eukprot:NP_001149542.1 MYND finger family protein [Zea mays]
MDASSVSPCDLDREFALQIAQLLATPPLQSAQEYYGELIRSKKLDGIRVSYSGKHGKGVYANRDFGEDDLVLKDQMLVGAQDSLNKIDCVVCSYCFHFIGSIEYQIGRRLYLQSLGGSGDGTTERHCHGSDVGSSTGCSGASNGNSNAVPQEVLLSLMDGNTLLPLTDQFCLPPVVACPGGCEGELYCSQSCADSDWDSYHSLLCAGSKTEPLRKSALQKFVGHANETNDIFLVAAKAITFTLLRYRKLKRQHVSHESSSSLLLEAWKPLSMGFKKRWWECVALPEDVDSSEEELFRQQIRDLAFTSLQLLKDAIFDPECAPLFSLDIYGHIIGMFELNNLDLVVASPVEDYFIYIDGLPESDKEEAEKVTGPFLDALGEDYLVPCEGTAFFPLQSCMNHSCRPNAKAFKRDEDKDGHAVIIALRPISKDEEITIAYIDEDLPYEERQAQLADYGFTCTCLKCQEERPV